MNMKTNDNKFNESLDFVVRNYKPDLFSGQQKEKVYLAVTGKQRVPTFFLSPRRIAAAAVATVLLASASCYFYISYSGDKSDASIPRQDNTSIEEVAPAMAASAVIEFNDSPLSEVVREIEKVYGVVITNLPDKDYRLTLRYEGNADDLVETINELLGIQLKIEGKR